jgi:DNA polymerase III alpha subunit
MDRMLWLSLMRAHSTEQLIFYQACLAQDIKPIIGLDAFLAPRTRFDKEPTDKPRSRLVLLAKTFEGYQGLIELVTRSNVDGFYYKPRLGRRDPRTTQRQSNLHHPLLRRRNCSSN